MNLELAGKNVLVGGASRGIGKAIAAAFVAEGANVTLTGRNAESLDAAMTDIRAKVGADRPDAVHAVAGDLGADGQARKAVEAAREKWGQLDILIANVGSGRTTPGWQASEDEWRDVFETNLWSSMKLVNAALPDMVEAGAGSIVAIGSIAGLEALGAPISYAAAKTALASYTANLARSVGRDGVRVNCVAPGNVYFEGGTWDVKMQEDEAGVRAMLNAEVPLNRFATPEEIADLTVFVASPRAGFMTGACVVADGGQTRGGHW